MVVPNANPKANKVAANAANPKGTIGRGSLRAALMSILTVFHPKESCKQSQCTREMLLRQALLKKWLATTRPELGRWLPKYEGWVQIPSIHINAPRPWCPSYTLSVCKANTGRPQGKLVSHTHLTSTSKFNWENLPLPQYTQWTLGISLELPRTCGPLGLTHVNMHTHRYTTHEKKITSTVKPQRDLKDNHNDMMPRQL